MLKNDKKKLAVLVSASIAASAAMGVAGADENPFTLNQLQAGYDLAKIDGEGKCGEGKCGEAKKAEKEGKCGEGKCGEDKKAEKEGKCGEGKCGGAS